EGSCGGVLAEHGQDERVGVEVGCEHDRLGGGGGLLAPPGGGEEIREAGDRTVVGGRVLLSCREDLLGEREKLRQLAPVRVEGRLAKLVPGRPPYGDGSQREDGERRRHPGDRAAPEPAPGSAGGGDDGPGEKAAENAADD